MNDSLLSSQLGSFAFGQAQNCIENDQIIKYCKAAMSCNYVIEDMIQKCGGQFHNDDDEADEADCLSRSGKCSRRVDCDKIIIFKHNSSLFYSSLPLLIIFYSSLAQLIIWEQKDKLFEPLPHRILLLSNIPTVGQKIKRESACKSILLSSIAST